MTSCVATMIAKVSSGRTTERNARLGEHRREIRDRQRLPEQDAAVAALAVQRVEAVEDADDERGDDDQAPRRSRTALRQPRAAAPGRAASGLHALRQAIVLIRKPNSTTAGDGQRRDIDRAVLPELAPHRPVQRPRRRRGRRGRLASRAELGMAFDGVFIGRSLRRAGLIAHHGDEQVGDAGRAHLAERGELLRGRRGRTAGCCGRTPGARGSA